MQKKKMMICSLFPIVLTVLILVFFKFKYHIVDDLLINYILEGVYGKSVNQYIILPYLSVVFTFPIYIIKMVFPQINVYLISLYFFMTVAFVVLNFLFYKKYQQIWLHCILCILQLIMFQYVTYTVVAYMICFVGILCLFDSTHIFKSIGLLFIGIGISIRKDIFFSLCVLFLPLIIYSYIKNKKITVVSIILCICVYLGISGIDSFVASRNSTIQSYLEWNDTCTQVRDFPMISYNDTDLIQSDISYNDYECIYSWIFTEKNSLGEEQLRTISQKRSFFQKYQVNPIKIILRFFSEPIYVMYFIFVCVIIIMYRWKNCIGLGIIFCTLGDLLALILRQRVVERVYIPLMICGVLLLLYEKKETLKNRKFQLDTIIQTFSFLWLIGMVIYGVSCKKWFMQENQNISQTYIYAHSHPDELFIFDGYSQLIKAQYPIEKFICNGAQFNKNLMTLGNWDTFSLRYYTQMKYYNIEQPDHFLGHLHEYEHVKFIMYPDSMKISFIEKWYLEHKNMNIKFNVVDHVGKMSVMEIEVVSYNE